MTATTRRAEDPNKQHDDADDDTIVDALHRMRSDIHPRVPNPAPLGLIGFGFTTCLLQMRTTQLAGKNGSFDLVMLGFAMFFGGLLQVIAGISEIRRNNLFGYTAFSLYGGFWMSIAAIDIVKFLATGQVNADPTAMQAVLSMLCLCSFMLWTLTFKLNKTLCILFFLLTCTCGLLASGVRNELMDKVGGYLGIVTSANAFWLAYAELVNDVYGGGTREVIPLGHWDNNPFSIHGGFHFPGRIFGSAGVSRHDNHRNRSSRDGKRVKMNCSFSADAEADEENGRS